MGRHFFRNYLFLYKNLLKVNWQLTRGVWNISQLPEPRVTVFGGSHIPAHSEFARQAHVLCHKLALANISVITGGGPGIMSAASCGSTHEKKDIAIAHTLGITVAGLDPEMTKHDVLCFPKTLTMSHFFTRKWLMMNFSIGFAVFPGGLGTLDELAEVAVLLQVKHLIGAPLILISKSYWKPLMNWFIDSALHHKLIHEIDLKRIRITDDIDEAYWWIVEHCELCNNMKPLAQQ